MAKEKKKGKSIKDWENDKMMKTGESKGEFRLPELIPRKKTSKISHWEEIKKNSKVWI